MPAGRKRTALGWVLAGFAAAVVLTLWLRPHFHTAWGWAAGAEGGTAWLERDWYLIESDEWAFGTHARWAADPSWTLPPAPAPTNAATARSVDLWAVRYRRFNLGPRSVWGVDVLLWPFAASALLLGLPLLVSGRRIQRRVRLDLCPSCGYNLAGLGPGRSCPECGGPTNRGA